MSTKNSSLALDETKEFDEGFEPQLEVFVNKRNEILNSSAQVPASEQEVVLVTGRFTVSF